MRDVSYPYFYENWQSRHALLFEWINVQKWPAYIMFGLITLVSIINLMAALTMIIQEKTGQIGILLSQGIKFYELKKIFMLMSGFIGLVGTLIGGGLASTVILIQKEFNFLKISSEVYFMDEIPFSFDPFLFFLIIIIILFISIIFSWFPVKILEKVNPSDVLKYE
jgi:lipoprotein-releasing system permease protein